MSLEMQGVVVGALLVTAGLMLGFWMGRRPRA